MVYSPIYRDTYYTTTADTFVYTIQLDGAVIYSGKAVKLPDADVIRININKVCMNYLSNDIAELFATSGTYITNVFASRIFSLVDEEDNVVEQYGFLYDYDYDHSWSGGETILSNPINGHYVDGMLKPKTNVTASNAVRTYKSTGSYPIQVKCSDYVLYYLNARGGWYAFVIEGQATKKDTITQYTTDRAFDNQTLEFETNRYVTEIKTSYILNTHYLNDEESYNLAKNLIGSNKVYLQNLKDGWIKPVVITDTSVTYQTYATNNRKLSQYKINVAESQMKIRR